MEFLVDPQVPVISPGDLSYFIYMVLLLLTFYIVFKLRGVISRNVNRVLLIFLILGLIQRTLITSWYLIIGEYALAYSLPLQICRVIVWLVIIQFFVRKEFINQTIFYIGLFAYAAFIYPVGIHPVIHVAGWSFFLLHGINVIFPLVMHYATGFMPSFKGLLQAYLVFVFYFFAVYLINPLIDGNYFFIEQRPFLYEMDEAAYIALNLVGTFIGFLVVFLLLKLVVKIKMRILKSISDI